MKLEDLVIRRELNPRKRVQSETVERYISVIDELPPIVVQSRTNVLIDGFHRVEAAVQSGLEVFPHIERDVPDDQLFAEACKANMAHGLPLTNEERNEAIYRLSEDGVKNNALSLMFGVNDGQISRIIGAKQRTKTVRHSFSIESELTARHEQTIRKAPQHLQDTIARIVLTRDSQMLTIPETQALISRIEAIGQEEVESALNYLVENASARKVPEAEAPEMIEDEVGEPDTTWTSQALSSVNQEAEIGNRPTVDWAVLRDWVDIVYEEFVEPNEGQLRRADLSWISKADVPRFRAVSKVLADIVIQLDVI